MPRSLELFEVARVRPAREGAARASTVACVVLLGAAFVTATWLFRGAPDLSRAPGWFYVAVNKGSFDMLLVAAAAAALPWLVRASFGWAGPRPLAAASCVFVGSVALQIATGLVARTQVHGWTERFFVGHGEFTARAKDVPDAIQLLRDYESLSAANQLGLFGPSKPPGTYAVYLALDRTARLRPVRALLTPLTEIVARDPLVPPESRELIAWTILVLQLCAALTVFPLCWLGRILFAQHADSPQVFTYPAWLFATAPATNVVTVHLDSTLFPWLSALSIAFCAWSVELWRRPGSFDADFERSHWPSVFAAAGGGCIALLAVYCSYGNLPILGIGAVLALSMHVQLRGEAANTRLAVRALVAPLAGFVAGVLLALLLLRVALDWQPIAGYVRGVGYHTRWRPNLPREWRYGLAFLEFSLFAGPPLMLAFIASGVRASQAAGIGLMRWLRARVIAPLPYGALGLTLATAGVIVVISLALGTPEAARLWLFMLPWVCCAATLMFTRTDFDRAFVMLLAGQVTLTFFVKNYLIW